MHIEGITSAMKNKMSFNKMLETQIAQLADAMPNPIVGKLSDQSKPTLKENVNTVTTLGEKSTQDPPHLLVAFFFF